MSSDQMGYGSGCFTDQLTLAHVLDKSDVSTRKTKILCTLGPSSNTVERLVEMLDLGMNVARLNFSHGGHQIHGEMVTRIREANKRRPDKACAIMLDTKGPEIRTGLLRNHQSVQLTLGQEIFINTDYSVEGDGDTITCSYKQLPTSVKPGSIILMADGTISCEVVECLENGVKARMRNSAKLGKRRT